MAARSKARKRALDVLFEAELRGEPPLAVLEARIIQAEPPVGSYAIELVQGVQAHRDEIDDLLATHARGWTLERMPAVDRNILRIGAYELLWGAEIPDAVAISEAVVLAKDLSTDASPAFVNGLLGKLAQVRPGLTPAADDKPVDADEPAEANEPADADEPVNAAGPADPAEPGVSGGARPAEGGCQ